MKAHLCFLLLACSTLSARAVDTPKLEVHEWGTLTVLSGSDGFPLQWYQGPGFLDELPAFVRFNPLGGKSAFSAGGSKVRMETPVIYFYPENTMRVNVKVSFQGGQVTEIFPEFRPLQEGAVAPWPLSWEGDLITPTDAAAKAQIPAVPAGKGDHYRHAREVPKAWIFRSTTAAVRDDKDPAKGKNSEKFIFYRGKGDYFPPYQVNAKDDGTIALKHWGEGGAIPVAFALTVKDGHAHWKRMPALDTTKNEDQATMNSQVTAQPDAVGLPIERAAAELAGAMREALVTAGLTADEARAMVATWDGHWFREPGTRVLAILPRAWVDWVLPLTITPAPTKLTRVFVARFETLTPERETTLLSLLRENAEANPGNTAAARFDGLQLGRFSQGALLRAQTMETQRMTQQFWKLQQSPSQPAAAAPKTAAK